MLCSIIQIIYALSNGAIETSFMDWIRAFNIKKYFTECVTLWKLPSANSMSPLTDGLCMLCQQLIKDTPACNYYIWLCRCNSLSSMFDVIADVVFFRKKVYQLSPSEEM